MRVTISATIPEESRDLILQHYPRISVFIQDAVDSFVDYHSRADEEDEDEHS